MRSLSTPRPVRTIALVGLVCGGIAGTASALLAARAVAQVSNPSPQAVIEATHNPPLLTLPGEPLELSYGVFCAAAGVEDPEQGCAVTGSVFVRGAGRREYRELPLADRRSDGLHELATAVPDALASSATASSTTRCCAPPTGAGAS